MYRHESSIRHYQTGQVVDSSWDLRQRFGIPNHLSAPYWHNTRANIITRQGFNVCNYHSHSKKGQYVTCTLCNPRGSCPSRFETHIYTTSSRRHQYATQRCVRWRHWLYHQQLCGPRLSPTNRPWLSSEMASHHQRKHANTAHCWMMSKTWRGGSNLLQWLSKDCGLFV